MSKQNNVNEEDYLDKLLNSVLSGNPDEVEDDIFDEELEGVSEFQDDFFQNMENGWDDTQVEIQENSESVIEETAKEVIAETEKNSTDSGKAMENIQPDIAEEMLETMNEVTAEASAEESVEQEMQGLFDILGVEEENAESSAEIETLEKKGKKKEKKKKDKKKKKLFGKKNKETEESMAVDVALDLMEQKEMEHQSENVESLGATEEIPVMSLMDALEGSQDELGSLDELAAMETLDDIPDISEKPKKAKKEKKPKKPKKAKTTKAKKKKTAKAKRPKGPAEIIPFSSKGLAFFLSVGVLVILMAVVGGSYTKYNAAIKDASTYYVNQNYGKAYEELSELSIKEKDQYFYDQVQMVMYVYHNYATYQNMMKLEYYEDGLDSLLNGVKMYDKYKDAGREDYNCFEDMTVVLGWINTALEETYGITESDAREINLLGSGRNYSYRVAELAAEAEERNNKADDSNN